MKTLLIGVVLGLALFVMPAATIQAAGLVPCGGPNEPECQSCYVVTLANNVVEWLVIILGTIAALIIVYAGVKLVTSGGNHHAKEEAKSMLTNILIGYAIILSGWLLVDYGLKALLSSSSQFGVWNDVQCVDQPQPDEYTEWSNPDTYLTGQNGWMTAPSGGAGATAARCESFGPGQYDCSLLIADCTAIHGSPTVSASGDVVTCTPAQYTVRVTGGGVQCAAGNTACSVSALQAAGMSAVQANVMSCIAMTESSGNPSTPPYNIAHPGSNSSACGTFQIVRTTWNANASGACSDFSMCTNASCNARVATALVRRNGYRDWTCPNCNNKASGCIAKFGG